ncbi:MAG: hypothetical protein JXA79_10250 [Deltaproteobacteria bacterium]|nr:hypothetical protein [Deltaproteobacteria bacterium]
MKTVKIGVPWLERVMQEGLPLHTVRLLSGPGGSGKPLIGDNFIAAWLRNGGSPVLMSLQYPRAEFIYESLKTIAGLDLNEYKDKICFISLDAGIDGMSNPEGNEFKANLVKPAIWDAAIDKACTMVPDEDPGIMVFGSALNLLFFPPTYGQELLRKIGELFRKKKYHTFVFSVSTTAKKEEIAVLEQAADNLIMTRSEDEPFRLFLRIVRMKDVPFSDEEVQAPIPPKSLANVREIAEHSSKRVIPEISKL